MTDHSAEWWDGHKHGINVAWNLVWNEMRCQALLSPERHPHTGPIIEVLAHLQEILGNWALEAVESKGDNE